MYVAKLIRGAQELDISEGKTISLGPNFVPPSVAPAFDVAEGSAVNTYGGGVLQAAKYSDRQWSIAIRIDATNETQAQFLARKVSVFLNADSGDDLFLEWKGAGGIPTPLYGQLGAPARYRIVAATVGLDGLYSEDPTRRVWFLPLDLRVHPFVYGIKQRLASATGGIWMDAVGTLDDAPWGVRVPPATTNKMTNPVFSHATYNNGWAAGSNINQYKNTNPRYCFPGSLASVLLSSRGSTNNTYTQTIDPDSTQPHSFSAVVRRPDGVAVTSADCQLYYNNAALTTTYQEIGNGFYLLYADGIATADTPRAVGLIIAANRTIHLLAYQYEAASLHTPIGHGDMLGWVWAGTPHASTSTRTLAQLKAPTNPEYFNVTGGSIVFIWTPDYPSTAARDRVLFCFSGAGMGINASFLAASDTFIFSDTINVAQSAAQTFQAGVPLCLVFTWGSNGLNIYKDGNTAPIATQATFTASAIPTALEVGVYSASGHLGGLIQGFAVYDHPFTAAEVTSVYSAVKPLMDARTCIASVPWLWTKDFDDVVDNLCDSTRANYAVAGGIPGDVPAETQFRITADSSGWDTDLWLGLHLDRHCYRPATNWVSEDSGAAEAGNSSGNYLANALPATEYKKSQVIPRLAPGLNGTFHFFSRACVESGSDTAKFQPYLHTNNGYLSGDIVSLPISTTYILTYSGSIDVEDFDDLYGVETFLAMGVVYRPIAGLTLRHDCSMYVNGKLARFRVVASAPPWIGAISTTRPSILLYGGRDVSYHDATTSYLDYIAQMTGDVIELVPGAYNVLQSFIGGQGEAWGNARTMTYTRVEITPRWSLL